MPLPSVSKYGAKQCEAKSKRTGLQCNSPAAHGTKACRMHGAHKSRNVLRGANHPQYKNAGFTKKEKLERNRKSIELRMLEELGHHIELFAKGSTKIRGRKPSGYSELDLNDPNQLAEALRLTDKKIIT